MVWLGPAPAGEACASAGDADYARDARAECRAFVEAIRKVCGREPEGARLVVQTQEHDFGDYYEVACVFDAGDDWARDYAARVEADAPTTWREAGMTPPLGRAKGRC